MPAPRKYPDPALGTEFGFGTVTAFASFKRTAARKNWERGAVLVCDCGTEYLADLAALYAGGRKSCGCKRKKRGFIATPGYASHPLYYTWHGMMDRCYNPDVQNYRWYGSRGIQVYPDWTGELGLRSFIDYVEIVLGPRPEGCTLDRIDNYGDYAPGNLRWATWEQQHTNQKHWWEDPDTVRTRAEAWRRSRYG